MARPRRTKTLKVHIKIIGPLSVNTNNIIAATNEIFAQAKVVVQFPPIEPLNLPEDELEFFEPMDVGACRSDPAQDQIDISAFRNNAGAKDVVAYVCRTIVGDAVDGCSSHPRGVPMVVIESQAPNSVLAHELGHLLMLDHCGDLLTNRLMNSSVSPIPPPLELTDDEIRRMRRSRLLKNL